MRPSSGQVLVHPRDDVLAAAVAARLVTRLVDLQAAGVTPSVVLTGGTIAEAAHRAVARSQAREAVDWGRVDFWFGDERYVPAGDEERNAVQAARAMLDHLPVDSERVHVMPASDGAFGADIEAAAGAYADELRAAAQDGEDTPVFDIAMLGIGPDGHCASLFPGRPELEADGTVVAVRESPKPPPERMSLTLRALAAAEEVWWLAAGEGKAEAVRRVLDGASVQDVPAAGPRGRRRTLWLLDEAALRR